MRTTYINNEGIKCGFIVSNCGRWVDCFKGSESNIINSFFTFGRHITNQSRPNLTPQFTKNEIVLQQRFSILFRGQKLVINECNKIDLSELDLKRFETYGQKNQYIPIFIDHLNTLTKDRQKTAEIYKKLLEINKPCQ